MPNLSKPITLVRFDFFDFSEPDKCGVCYLTAAAMFDPKFFNELLTLSMSLRDEKDTDGLTSVLYRYWRSRCSQTITYGIIRGYDSTSFFRFKDPILRHGQAAYRFHVLGDMTAAQELAKTYTKLFASESPQQPSN